MGAKPYRDESIAAAFKLLLLANSVYGCCLVRVGATNSNLACLRDLRDFSDGQAHLKQEHDLSIHKSCTAPKTTLP